MFQQQLAGKKFVVVLLSFFCLLSTVGGAAAVSPEPMAQIKTSVDEILRIVRESKADSKSVISDVKRQRIMDVVYDRFDFRAMSQLAMARNWKAITAKEQDRFVTLFAKVLENTYYDRINSYSGEVILFKEQELKDDKAVVSSVVVKNNTETPVVYRLRSVGGKWMVYDVIIEGVSLVRNYRTQFDSIIEKEKYDGLIRRLEEKIAKKETN